MARHRQKLIPGAFDAVTEDLIEKGEEFVGLLNGRMRQQEAEEVARAELLELMTFAGLESFNIDGYRIDRVHKETDKITVKEVGKTVE